MVNLFFKIYTYLEKEMCVEFILLKIYIKT